MKQYRIYTFTTFLLLCNQPCLLSKPAILKADDSFAHAVEQLCAYTLQLNTTQTEPDCLHLTRTDQQLFVELATPVCKLLVDHETLQPLSTPPLLSTQHYQELSVLAAYCIQQKTFPKKIEDACAEIARQCAPLTRTPGLEEQRFTASHAIADVIKRGHDYQSRTKRLDDTEHKKQQRLTREKNIRMRQEMRLEKHMNRQKRLHQNQRLTNHRREHERYTKESRMLRNRKYLAMKKDSVAQQKRTEYTTTQEQAILDKKARHKAAREALQKNQ